ncbi:MAG: hypothetical protein QXT53_00960 [Ignisphaera sp.]
MVGVVWSVSSNPSGYRDGAYSCCVFGDILFVVGFDEVGGFGRQRYRVESRRVSDGSSTGVWVDDRVYGFASLFSCAVVRGGVVVVGATDRFWSLVVFDKNLSVVARRDFESSRFIPYSVDSDGDVVFVGGVEFVGERGYAIHVEALSADDLSHIGFYTSSPMERNAAAYSVVYNPMTKGVVVGGFDEADGFRRWRIEMLSRDLSLSRVVRPDVHGSVTGLAVGSQGFVYAVGRGGVAKIDRNGEAASLTKAVSGAQIVASPSDSKPIGRYVGVVSDKNFHVLDKSLKLVDSAGLVRGAEITFVGQGKPAMDSERVYIVANTIATDVDWGWRILALNPSPSIFRRIIRS